MSLNTQFPFNIKQSDPMGCIPTNIGAAIDALGIRGITERHVTQAYFSTICFANIVKLEVLSKLTIDGHRLSDLLNLEFYDASSFEDWWTHVTDWLHNHRFVLFAARWTSSKRFSTLSIQSSTVILAISGSSPW